MGYIKPKFGHRCIFVLSNFPDGEQGSNLALANLLNASGFL